LDDGAADEGAGDGVAAAAPSFWPCCACGLLQFAQIPAFHRCGFQLLHPPDTDCLAEDDDDDDEAGAAGDGAGDEIFTPRFGFDAPFGLLAGTGDFDGMDRREGVATAAATDVDAGADEAIPCASELAPHSRHRSFLNA